MPGVSMAEELPPSDRLSSSLPDWKKFIELRVTPEFGHPRESPDFNRRKVGATHPITHAARGRDGRVEFQASAVV